MFLVEMSSQRVAVHYCKDASINAELQRMMLSTVNEYDAFTHSCVGNATLSLMSLV